MTDVFTDGSCHTQLRVGTWVAIIRGDGVSHRLSGLEQDTTHQRMELMAVLQAMEWVVGRGQQGALRLVTDSQYVSGLVAREAGLRAKNFIAGSGKPIANSDLLPRFYELVGLLQPAFTKVKAHQHNAGVPSGNHEADEWCRKLLRDAIKNIEQQNDSGN